jgi:hypothetical protein
MSEIRRLSEDSAEHYISFLENNGLGNIGNKAKMILPTDTKQSNVAGDGVGLPVIHSNFISLTNLVKKTDESE